MCRVFFLAEFFFLSFRSVRTCECVCEDCYVRKSGIDREDREN